MHVVTSVALHLESIAAAATLAVHNADLRSLLPQVVGGKMTESGRLCAFITKVRKGSLADTVGHLRPGMENTNSLTLTCISLCMNVYIKRFTADSTEKKTNISDVFASTGDQVLEWNGKLLQGATFKEVYNIILDSKPEPQVELVVSRPIG